MLKYLCLGPFCNGTCLWQVLLLPALEQEVLVVLLRIAYIKPRTGEIITTLSHIPEHL